MIKQITLDRDETTGFIRIIFDREYPELYDLNPDRADAFIIEKYKIDANNMIERQEMMNVVRSQTMMQYFNSSLFMSALFHIVPRTVVENQDYNFRYGDLGMPPEFIDITEEIKNNTSEWIDENTDKNHLYIYRVVYSYNGIIKYTDYVAGFERIGSINITENLPFGTRTNKAFICDELKSRIFGATQWRNIDRYSNTAYNDVRREKYQEPVNLHFPMQRMNHRYRGPLEGYKLIAQIKETARIIKLFDGYTKNIVSEKDSLLRQTKLTSVSILNNFGISDREKEDILTIINETLQNEQSGILSIIFPDIGKTRILGTSRLVNNASITSQVFKEHIINDLSVNSRAISMIVIDQETADNIIPRLPEIFNNYQYDVHIYINGVVNPYYIYTAKVQ
jgi:hypothetical protein